MKPYACHNRELFRPTVIVQDGWIGPVTQDVHTRHARMVAIPFRMSADCNYTHTDLGKSDVRCGECKHRASVGA